MIETEVRLDPERIGDRNHLLELAARACGTAVEAITGLETLRRSIDARGRSPFFRVQLRVWIGEAPPAPEAPVAYPPLRPGAPEAIVVGCGPAGLFAALHLIEKGVKPVLLERGKDHQSRRKDLRAVQQFNVVDPDSNYCFGEGGAGTYSDGKLYTRSSKRGDIRKILRVLVQHGADPDILVDAHPHIGSNRLYRIVEAMRRTILDAGGEVRFQAKVTGLLLKDGKARGVVFRDGAEERERTASGVILATGHSARDVFAMLHRQGLEIQAKPFALGVRIEHPQSLIDAIRYRCPVRPASLPAASYGDAVQVAGRGVYSFCMCPGGLIIPAATAPGEIVVNGMSMFRRDSPFANSGFVVEVREEDWAQHAQEGPFAALRLQESVERAAWNAAGGTQKAPGQRVTDFAAGRASSTLPKSSYIPGLTPSSLEGVLPAWVSAPIKEALRAFDRKMPGYFTAEAILVATESRTSSPVRVPRDKETLCHPQAEGLYPAGEGAGYAGGIVSAAMDGEACAAALAARVR